MPEADRLQEPPSYDGGFLVLAVWAQRPLFGNYRGQNPRFYAKSSTFPDSEANPDLTALAKSLTA
jgi:hypothetical protein